VRCSEWKTIPFVETTSAFSLRTSTTALLAETTARGWLDPLSTSALPMVFGQPSISVPDGRTVPHDTNTAQVLDFHE
jgi:hypothetical protein